MPLQTELPKQPLSLQLGQPATTQSQFRFSVQCAMDLTQTGATALPYGTLIVQNSDGSWGTPAAGNAGRQAGIVEYDYRSAAKTSYAKNDLITVEVVGDRVVKTITGITVKAFDPLWVYVLGANAGLFSNVADATPANTKRVNGFFLADKASTDVMAQACYSLLAPFT